jgi:hypothetical protein
MKNLSKIFYKFFLHFLIFAVIIVEYCFRCAKSFLHSIFEQSKCHSTHIDGLSVKYCNSTRDATEILLKHNFYVSFDNGMSAYGMVMKVNEKLVKPSDGEMNKILSKYAVNNATILAFKSKLSGNFCIYWKESSGNQFFFLDFINQGQSYQDQNQLIYLILEMLLDSIKNQHSGELMYFFNYCSLKTKFFKKIRTQNKSQR